jgi:hypothetical protein
MTFTATRSKSMRSWRAVALVAACGAIAAAASAQAPQSHGKATELVIIQYEKLVQEGEFLTPEGWKRLSKLYAQSKPFPGDGTISLMSTGGSLGEMWVNGDHAEVDTKWTDYFGSITPSLRYKPPTGPPGVMTGYVFHLVYTNKHTDIGADGKTIREITGPWEWKIEEPQNTRWTTVRKAIEYLTEMRDKTDDPAIQKNADKTILALKHMHIGCGTASAC